MTVQSLQSETTTIYLTTFTHKFLEVVGKVLMARKSCVSEWEIRVASRVLLLDRRAKSKFQSLSIEPDGV